MYFDSGHTHLGCLEKDPVLIKALRCIERNKSFMPEEVDFSCVDELRDSAALIARLNHKNAAQVAHAIQVGLLRLSDVVRHACPDRTVSQLQYRYIHYDSKYGRLISDFRELHTDPSPVILCSFGTDVTRTEVFKGSFELQLPSELEGFNFEKLYAEHYAFLMGAFRAEVARALAGSEGKMISLDEEGTVDLLERSTIHARSRLLKPGHRHLLSAFLEN